MCSLLEDIGFQICSLWHLEKLNCKNVLSKYLNGRHSRTLNSLKNLQVCNVLQLRSDESGIIWCFSLRSASKTQTRKQHWSKSVSAAIFSRTKGRRCVLLFVKQPHESFLLFGLSIQWFQGTGVFYWSRCDMAAPDSFWHVSCLMLTLRRRERIRDWLVRTVLGHRGAPGIHVDRFGAAIMFLSQRIQSTHCTHCFSQWQPFFTKYYRFRSNKTIQSSLVHLFDCYIFIYFSNLFFNWTN